MRCNVCILLISHFSCCRDDDDINDVASMAGVNLNEESARILATNSELVGTQIRSCKDEAFLHPGLLHRRILETGEKSHAPRPSCNAAMSRLTNISLLNVLSRSYRMLAPQKSSGYIKAAGKIQMLYQIAPTLPL